ncbi:MAG: ribosome silencing factor [Deltaproteobacteria bacterium]|nr:ribosome silencing factor [Deltaproteobacteria bacterium]
MDSLLEKKARDVVVLDIRRISAMTDFVIICGGSSDRQISSIANNLIDSIKKRPFGVEGLSGSRWVVIDYGDVIIHIIHDDLRPYYNLEGLWPDAKELIVEN